MKRFFFFISFICFLNGCNRPNPNPELLDPGVNDIKEDIDLTSAQIATLKSIIKKAEEELANAIPQTGEAKIARRKIEDKRELLTIQEQKLEFYKMSLEKRIQFSRDDYSKAFSEGKPWPSPDTVEQYKHYRRLLTSNRNWDSRVPKNSLNSSTRPPEKKATSSSSSNEGNSGKEGGGGH